MHQVIYLAVQLRRSDERLKQFRHISEALDAGLLF